MEHNQCGGPLQHWIVVNTQPHREHVALENLLRQEFVAYCPRIRRRIRHARQSRDVLRPIFPGYLFVQVNPDLQLWRPILSTYGVRTLVRCGDRLSFLDDAFIESLKEREIDGAIMRPASTYEPGQQVKLTGGAFDSLVATILELDEKDRLVVLMDLLNRPTKVTVHMSYVTPAWR
jgi:transcriptional antiterminator RfaH